MRKIIATLLSVLLIFSLAAPALAATVTPSVSSPAIKAGEAVTVTVTLDEDVEDIVMYQYSLYYNKDLFTLTGSTGSATVSNSLSDGDGDYYMISFVDTTSEGVTISAGTLAALTFQAKADMTEEQAAGFLLRQDYFWNTNYVDVDGIGVENGTVSVTVSPAVTEYTVTLPQNPVGYTVAPAAGSASPVAEGGSYSFTVTVDTENYEGTPVVKANGGELSAVDGVYTIENITANQEITVEGITEKAEEPTTYTVTLPTGAGYTVAPAAGSVSPVAEGGSYSFTVTVDTENYEGTPVVKANGINLTASDGIYTIANITEDQTVTVEGLQEQGVAADRVIYRNGSNGAQWPSAPVYINTVTLKGLSVTDVVWDENYEICTVTLHKKTAANASYSLATTVAVAGQPQMISMFSANINGTNYTGNSFSYSGMLENGQAEITFTAKVQNYSETKTIKLVVDGTSVEPEPETYEVTLTQGEGYTIAAAEGSVSPVAEGGSFSFTVTVDTENYEGAPVVMANGTKLTAVDGVYTIENITAAQTVTVEGITERIKTYTVLIGVNGPGVEVTAVEGSVSPVLEGGSYSFTVTVTDGYEGTPVVTVNGAELSPVNGIYTIENITENQTVLVNCDGVTEKVNTYTVTLTEGTGYTIAATEGSASPVTEGGSFSFTVSANDGYGGTAVVKANGTELTAQNGVYIIRNITEDQTVTVEGIALKANTYIVAAAADVTASRGGSVTVSVHVTGNSNTEITAYNDYDVTITYDSEALEYVSAAAAHSGAEITVQAGTIRIVGHGDAKAYTDALVSLTFTARTSGIHEVSISSAYIDNSGNAISLNAPKAAVSDGLTLVKVAYPVTLPENFTGESVVLPGESYSFTAPNACYDITVTVGGKEVTPDVEGLVYTISGVDGDVVITATGKTYKVTKAGDNVTFTGAEEARYGEDYTFTVAANSGYAVTNVSVKVGGTAVDYTISGGSYIVSGSKITGDVEITATTGQQAANTTQITFEGVTSGEVVGGLVHYVTNGQDFTFELNEEAGYVYTVKLGDEELKPTDGVYTIPGAQINGTALTITVTKALYSFNPSVAVSPYIQLDGTVMWLVTATEGSTVLAYGEGNTMFWSDKYNAYCWLVISSGTQEEVKEAAQSTIIAAGENAVAALVSYDCDVNQSGSVDVNDAQLTYDMYQAKLYSGFDIVTMDKFLEADVNGDAVVNVEDAAAVVAQIVR